MDQWLDSLSEDWPSQPPSQHNSSSFMQDTGSPNDHGSRSRIPRRRASNVSVFSKEKETGKGSSTRINHAGKAPLKERTNSSLNAALSSLSNHKIRSSSHDIGDKRKTDKKSSAPSTPSMPTGTIAFKASPAKAPGETPEWKRRVIQGKVGPGDQTDMFGPISLQSVFRPPSISSKVEKRQDAAPSSPQGLTSPEKMQDLPRHMPRPPSMSLVKGSSRLRMERDIGDDQECDEDVPSESREKEASVGIQAKNSQPHSSEVLRRYPSRSLTVPASEIPSTPLTDGQNGSRVDQSDSNRFSPVIISRSHTTDGKLGYAVVDNRIKHPGPAKDFHTEESKVSYLRQGEKNKLSNERAASAMSFRKSQMNEITSQSLPEDLSVGTDAFAANGGYVSTRRGGYSNEGSFHDRKLSPSSPNDLDGPSGDFTRALSHVLLSSRHSNKPSTDHPSPPKTPKKDDDEQPRSSGSPLKLFDKYDTFTNNRLARHISRFEETIAQNETTESIVEDELPPSTPSTGPKIAAEKSWMKQYANKESRRRVSSFGSGKLDRLDFKTSNITDADPSLPCLHYSNGDAPLLPGRRQDMNTDRAKRGLSLEDHNDLAKMSELDDNPSLNDGGGTLQFVQRSSEVTYTVNGKRLPNSPQKTAARKRRRTLCSSEERKRDALNGQTVRKDSSRDEILTTVVASRKRKDARHGSENQIADPKVLATRQILRPRNPTPSQTCSSTRQTPLARSEFPHSVAADVDVRTTSIPKIDPPTQIVAGALATVALSTVQDMETGSRKVSVTTSDFFNEAQQIMALIRAEKRPRSSQNSAETSNIGPSAIHEEPSLAESTKDDLTRPPSREASHRRLQVPKQHDARVVSHLRKFEDKDDLGLTLPSSGKSLKISNCDIASVATPARLRNEDRPIDTECDPPNIRIRATIRDEKQSDQMTSKTDDENFKTERAGHKIDSQGSANSSGPISVPTGSSRGSANIHQIVPQSVAHLLSDQMADMLFDKERQVWVKRKAPDCNNNCDAGGYAMSNGTEEDLFGGISDLSVDEIEELKMVKIAVSRGNTANSGRSAISAHDQAPGSALNDDGPAPQEANLDQRPRTADGKIIGPVEDSSVPSKYTNFAWSGPMPGTRATSYGDEIWSDKKRQEHQSAPPAASNAPPSPEVEHEFSILDGRANCHLTLNTTAHRQPRVVTVAFSSPLIQSPYQADEDSDENDQLGMDESPSRQASQLQMSTRRLNSSISTRFPRRSSHRLSFGNSSIIARPMSRLDEQDEHSLVQYSGRAPGNFTDLAKLTPLPCERSWIAPPATGHQSGLGFELSPLADFTVHQVDRPLDNSDSMIVGNSRLHKVSHALSLTAQELVKNLTDLEPFEPYWYYIREIILRGRGLSSLHMLDEFCGNIQELDVSQNRIRELEGVPSTVRSLNIKENYLSELTSWHNLLHLQYLDVSGNQLRSLKGFQGLLHLRELRADNNQIENLDGVEQLDGLLSLRLRNNNLIRVDFERSNLTRLKDIDFRGNSLADVGHTSYLSSLENLNLSMNNIKQLHFDDPMPHLRILDVADNCLDRIDITYTPKLKTLIVDRNAVHEIKGLTTHTKLESLLWREQQSTKEFDRQLHECREIHNLYASGTSLSPSFTFKMQYLNLNTLEMASMSLQSLPKEFGMMCRNLRTLNLNYNAIHDIRPLLGITRLRKLYLAGNRLSRLRRTAAVVDRLSTELMELDLRNNPLTVGFYTPQTTSGTGERRLVVHNILFSGEEDKRDYTDESNSAHLLPNLDKDADNASRERLDEDTKLRRRVYEMLLVSSCKYLQRLDGLEVNRSMVAEKDGIWERLVELDVLRVKVKP